MSSTLLTDQVLKWEEVGEGLKRKVMAYDPTMMMVKVAFQTGGIGALHHHPHTQASYVASGKFETTVGEDTKILTQGDAFFVPSNVPHGVVCLEEGEIIDVFTPMREDFL